MRPGEHDLPAHLLIRAGADVNAADREGVTVLMKAAHGGDPAVVNRLLREPALSADRPGPHGNTALTYAILYGHAEMVEALVEHGANVNITRANGTTPRAIADHARPGRWPCPSRARVTRTVGTRTVTAWAPPTTTPCAPAQRPWPPTPACWPPWRAPVLRNTHRGRLGKAPGKRITTTIKNHKKITAMDTTEESTR
jgi:hypothetical protein